jgi:hypothetical protein
LIDQHRRHAVDRPKHFLSRPLRLFALQLIPIARSRSPRGASIGEAAPGRHVCLACVCRSRITFWCLLSGAPESRTPAQPLCSRPDADPPALFFFLQEQETQNALSRGSAGGAKHPDVGSCKSAPFSVCRPNCAVCAPKPARRETETITASGHGSVACFESSIVWSTRLCSGFY